MRQATGECGQCGTPVIHCYNRQDAVVAMEVHPGPDGNWLIREEVGAGDERVLVVDQVQPGDRPTEPMYVAHALFCAFGPAAAKISQEAAK